MCAKGCIGLKFPTSTDGIQECLDNKRSFDTDHHAWKQEGPRAHNDDYHVKWVYRCENGPHISRIIVLTLPTSQFAYSHVYQAKGPRTNNHLEGWHNRLNKMLGSRIPICSNWLVPSSKKRPVLTWLSCSLLQRSPCKKRCVEIDRRIETMMQRFEDSTINLTEYLSGLSYLDLVM